MSTDKEGAVVDIRDLSFQYEGADGPALRHVSLELRRGETTLLLGPSGGGKSTLLLCLNGLIPQRIPGSFSGQVSVAGLDVATHEVYQMAEQVGLVFQDPEAQFCMLYVEDEVAFGLENLRYPLEEIRQRVAWALGQVGLGDKVGARLDRLSGGEKQKVALAAVLAMSPQVLALDAPTANLDPASARDFWGVLRRLKAETGQTLIIVEQQVDELIDMVDRLALMNAQGEIMADGRPGEVIDRLGAETLMRHGIWLPQTWELAQAANGKRLPGGAYPLTMQEAYASLAPVFQVPSIEFGGGIRESGNQGSGNQGIRPHLIPNSLIPDSPVADSLTTAPNSVVRVEGLSHTYAGAPGGAAALQDVHLRIGAGDFCAIVGQNGAGKTTLAKYLTKIMEPPPGKVFLNGADVARVSLGEVARQVGYVFQNPEHQFVADTVYDELAYGLRVRGVDEETVRARVLDMLDTFRLRPLAHLHPFSLSQGEKRRLSVGTMLILGPDVLILDEPTLGQDRASAVALMDIMRELNARGTTVIFITHDMRLVAEHARSAVVMARGTVIFQGRVGELFERTDVMAAAALLAPPVVLLAQQLRRADPAFPRVASMAEFRQLLGRG